MATIAERLAVLEMQVKNLQRAIWALVVAVGGQVGINFLPIGL